MNDHKQQSSTQLRETTIVATEAQLDIRERAGKEQTTKHERRGRVPPNQSAGRELNQWRNYPANVAYHTRRNSTTTAATCRERELRPDGFTVDFLANFDRCSSPCLVVGRNPLPVLKIATISPLDVGSGSRSHRACLCYRWVVFSETMPFGQPSLNTLHRVYPTETSLLFTERWPHFQLEQNYN